MTLDDIDMVINEISHTKTEASNLIDHVHNNNNRRIKRSLLPLGGLFSFIFDTADQSDVDSLKVISVKEPTQMEIKCTDHSHVKTLQPPITLISLQPACSTFSPQIKLPPYFKQYSKGFHIAIQVANLHLPKFTPTNFRIWTPFNLSKITPIEIENLKKLTPAPAIPTDKMGAHIANFRHIEVNKAKSLIYYIGDGSGSGLILFLQYVEYCTGDVSILRVKKPYHLLLLPILFKRIEI